MSQSMLQRMPCLLVLLAYGVGLYCAPNLDWHVCLLVLIAIAVLCFKGYLKRSTVIVMLCFIGLGFFRGALAFHIFPATHIRYLQHEDGEILRFHAVVRDDVSGKQFALRQNQDVVWPRRRVTIKVELEQVFDQHGVGMPVSGTLQLRSSELLPLHYGDKVEIVGQLFRINKHSNPGAFNYAQHQWQRGIYRSMSIDAIEQVKVLQRDEYSMFANLFSFRDHLTQRLSHHLKGQDFALYATVLLGNRSMMEEDLNAAFVESGTMHLLSISGLHLLCWVAFFALLLKLLRCPQRLSMVLLMAFCLFYVLLVGMRPASIRAMIMVWMYCLGVIVDRKGNIFNSLALAAWLILLIRPSDLWTAGFSMSFLAVLGIVVITPRLEKLLLPDRQQEDELQRLLRRPSPWLNIKRFLLQSLAVSAGAFSMIFPVIWYNFNVVSVLSVFANVLGVLALMAMLLMGILLLLVDAVLPAGATVIAKLASIFSSFIAEQATAFSSIKFGHLYLPDLSFGLMLGYFLILAIILYPVETKVTKLKVVLSASLLLVLLGAYHFYRIQAKDLQVSALQVANGSNVIIEYPGGAVVMYDCGSHSITDIGARITAPFLWHRNISKVDALILSHQDADHINGVLSLLRRVNVETIYVSPYFYSSDRGKAFLESIKEFDVSVKQVMAGDQISIAGETALDVLHPNQAAQELDTNNQSLLVRLTYGDSAVLLTGDLESKGFAQVQSDFNATVMIVPHHGSFLAENLRILNQVKAQVAILSANEQFASVETVRQYQSENIELYFTGRDGAVTLTLDKKQNVSIDPHQN